MIVRPKQSWFRLLFVWHGSVLPAILPQLGFMAAVSVLAVVSQGRILGEKIPLNATLLTPFGLTLAIFLGFRNNASYERFNEARHLWGNLLIASRALVSELRCYLRDPAPVEPVAHQLLAAVYALKHELRRTDPDEDLIRLVGRRQAFLLRRDPQPSTAALHAVRERLCALQDQGRLSDVRFWTLDAQLTEIGKAIGGCERIASTPIPYAYGVLLHRTVYTYCVLLPFGLVDATEFFTPLLCVFLSYTLIALEAVANEVCEPFGPAPNALALDAIARGIERSVLALCGREPPEPVVPNAAYQLT
ncbi:bestrophin family protein [Roseateles chitosanitabidus]|uniref:bestrophin family protein n=1 Tax=Roseateles chitosanitabidus TaxID=65048 RepID=UPI000835FEEC|nr:bestrophin family ion channel [Roseateles chitosanitabidus]